MTVTNETKKEEWEMIGHEPVPGYRAALYIAVLLAVIYLIFAFSTGGGGGGH